MSSGSTVESTVSADGSGPPAGSGTAGGGNGNTKCSGNISLTPRFTQEEKEILYALFHQHEEVIDIKYRKKQRNKFAVRDAWEQIVREFNSHPNVNAMRNVKQVQKFWLNARLRKQYPFRGNNNNAKSHANNNNNDSNENDLSDPAIKHEPELHINENDPTGAADGEEFEEIEMDSSVIHEADDDPIDTDQQHEEQETQQQQQHQQQQQQQIQQTNTIQTQQISVDQISAEKLTLNDLLQFKTTRPREEIILQIKHPADGTGPAQITLPSPTRISIPTHQQTHQHATMATITASGFNQQIISEIKPQQITLAQYQAQQQQQLQQQQQQQLAQQQLAAAAVAAVQQQQQHQQQQQQNQQLKMQIQQSPATGTVQYANGQPTFTCTTYSAVPVTNNSIAPGVVSTTATPSPATIMNSNNLSVTNLGSTPTTNNDTFEEKLNYFKLKEAEIRVKEQQVALERKKIDLNRAQEELKHLREMYRLQVDEMKTKIRILQEEEKNLRKNHNLTQSP